MAGIHFAPQNFRILGKEEKKQKGNLEEEWKELLLVDGAKWKFQEWKFFLVEKEMSIRRIRIRVLKTGGHPRVILKNIRMFE